MSEFNSTVKQVNTIESRLAEIKEEVQTSGVTSDHKREQLLKEKDNLEKSCQKAKQKLNKLISKKVEDEDKKQVLQNIQKKVEGIEKEFVEVENTIIDAPYSTKCDLPSSYPNEVRKVYERIIAVIDAYFVQDIETAKNLRTKIIEELAVNPKSKKRK